VSLKSLRAACAAALLLFAAHPAVAGTLGIAGDYNGFIFNNLNASGGDTEGRLAVGNNFTASSYGVGVQLTNSHGTRTDLVVGNNMNAAGAWQVFNGNAVYGTTLTAAPTTPNGTTFQGTPVDFAAAQADLQAKSAYWATLPANGTSVFQFSTLTLNGTDPTLNIFQVAASDWTSSSDKQIHIPSGSTAIINIAGTSLTFGGGLAINGDSSQSNPAETGVIYNFPTATSVTPSHIAVLGSLLAPFATLTLDGGNVNGVGMALNAVQQGGGEFHYHPFTGNVPDPPVTVPEPTTAALLFVVAFSSLLHRRGH